MGFSLINISDFHFIYASGMKSKPNKNHRIVRYILISKHDNNNSGKYAHVFYCHMMRDTSDTVCGHQTTHLRG